MYNSNDSVVDDCNFRPEAGYLQTRQQLQVESVLAHKTPMKGKTQLSLYLRTAFFILALLLRFACLFFPIFFLKKKADPCRGVSFVRLAYDTGYPLWRTSG